MEGNPSRGSRDASSERLSAAALDYPLVRAAAVGVLWGASLERAEELEVGYVRARTGLSR